MNKVMVGDNSLINDITVINDKAFSLSLALKFPSDHQANAKQSRPKCYGSSRVGAVPSIFVKLSMAMRKS
jgi:hypothetical protein